MTEKAAAHTENSIIIDAPMDLVWDMTNDVESWPELYSEYASAKILERRGATIVFRLTMKPDENGTMWSWVSERTPDPETRTVEAHRVETGPFAYMNIRWTYTQTPEGVEMRWTQNFHMKDSAPLDDTGMAARINRNTPEQMGRIKRLVEAEALRRTPGVPGAAR